MIGVDTNVLLRFLVVDDPDQNRAAANFFAARTAEDPAFISALALAETVWLLMRRMNYPAEAVIEVLRKLLAAESIAVEHAEELGMLVFDEDPPVSDLADFLIAWAGKRSGCSSSVTFDKRAARTVPGMELLS
ncbi:PIN domain-containing protein [Nitratireductor sp. CH_MIT9313-5]|jgi:predicted nucleic-acid-binding protein|uniref:PIN domain-containing protein n=1 Tax=Nitratireductor sp. CH_MIT9313-5 TaxID=3107764 RepID=UPI0030093F55